MRIEAYVDSQRDAVVELSLRAWAPVFASLEVVLGPAVFRAFYRGDWRAIRTSSYAASHPA